MADKMLAVSLEKEWVSLWHLSNYRESELLNIKAFLQFYSSQKQMFGEKKRILCFMLGLLVWRSLHRDTWEKLIGFNSKQQVWQHLINQSSTNKVDKLIFNTDNVFKLDKFSLVSYF